MMSGRGHVEGRSSAEATTPRMRVARKFVAATATCMAAAALWQRVAEDRELRRFPPAGRLVDVGGHRLHMLQKGSGTPVVVLDAGLGGTWESWGGVIDGVADFTSVVAYDRAGLGHSDAAKGTRMPSEVAAKLHGLLDRAGVPGPYVLAGHSLGGLHIRAFAHAYPDAVSGLVYVDVSHEHMRDQAEGSGGEAGRPPAMMQRLVANPFRIFAALAPFGLHRVMERRGWSYIEMVAGHLDVALSEALRASYRTRKAQSALAAEVAAVDAGLAEVAALRAAGGFPDVPAVVLSGGKVPAGMADGERVTALMHELHRDLATMSSSGTHLVLEDSGHLVPFEQPQAVIAAVREVVDAARSRAGDHVQSKF